MELIISLIAGAVGGNAVGNAIKRINQGTVLNSLVGIIGGSLGGQILNMLGTDGPAVAGGLDVASIMGQVVSGGVGGGVLLALIGLFRGMTSK